MTLERMKTFSKREQLLFLGSEFERARVWQMSDLEKFLMALRRALEILDLLSQDAKWHEQIFMLEYLKSEVGKFYRGENKNNIAILYQAL